MCVWVLVHLYVSAQFADNVYGRVCACVHLYVSACVVFVCTLGLFGGTSCALTLNWFGFEKTAPYADTSFALSLTHIPTGSCLLYTSPSPRD